jgi:hypothetical protein
MTTGRDPVTDLPEAAPRDRTSPWSVNSTGSLLSVNSVGSILSFASVASALSYRSVSAVLGAASKHRRSG